MDLGTVGGVVEALVATYAAGLKYYTKWQQRKWQGNYYQSHSRGNSNNTSSCALSTSLSFSIRKIKETYDSGVDILGRNFATGDKICRDALQSDLEHLQGRIHVLLEALRADNAPLELLEVVRVSESVRISCLAALASQYRRVAVGRLVPRILPGSQRQSRLSAIISEEDTTKPIDNHCGADDEITVYTEPVCHAINTNQPPYLPSEPPSPPLTPKQIPDDLQSTCTSITSGYGPRPKNSVFSTFCPEGLKYQVNPRKTMSWRRHCRCGYEWNGPHTEDEFTLIIKEGFRITARFLGKSHCEGGFGCVLCTSSGRTETYSNVEELKAHINSSHTKWQLLHDRDMTGY
ncbi:uncharacterized protein F4822DRAFT_55353 [Hypoxylon trugodes]|uniref:uncharacterized protein n=1 Tax=Hypoxylon trugodes TaxID=326681 RepID=UPI0021946B99|nr:uncharacterized protein F4822DRAFT_55353 [Hypoxylon trugodes]KAI1383916.1 hypothetical protein F4822DRAFT_55353 [Hypoxylon trugodes]